MKNVKHDVKHVKVDLNKITQNYSKNMHNSHTPDQKLSYSKINNDKSQNIYKKPFSHLQKTFQQHSNGQKIPNNKAIFELIKNQAQKKQLNYQTIKAIKNKQDQFINRLNSSQSQSSYDPLDINYHDYQILQDFFRRIDFRNEKILTLDNIDGLDKDLADLLKVVFIRKQSNNFFDFLYTLHDSKKLTILLDILKSD